MMPDRVRRLLPIATLCSALAVVVSPARTAAADMVLGADGKWWPIPANVNVPGAEDEPNDDLVLQSRDARVDATYETVKCANPQKLLNKPAAFIRKIRSADALENADFRQGNNNAAGGFWKDAAENFRAAAGALNGCGKQEALWSLVRVTAATGDPDATSAAIDDLIAAFPKSFYFADAHILKAKIAKQKGDAAGVSAALDKIKTAAGMNPRDLFRAEHMRTFLTLEAANRGAEAATAYKDLVARMTSDKDAALLVSVKQQCQVGLGNCLLVTGKGAEARAQFEAATESHDADVLAGAYAGLGDIVFTEAKGLRDAKNLEGAKQKLEEALRHYLRVTLLYAPSVEEDTAVFHAMENQSKIFRTLWEMGNRKEIDLIDRALRTINDLGRKMPQGPQRAAIVREAQDIFKARKDALAAADDAKPPTPAPAAPAKDKDDKDKDK
jgi:tetratricopeptide (TPR) repeat protein